MRVLTVDDEPAIRRSLQRMLAPMGLEVVAAEDGIDAAGKLAAMAFDAVITDLRMPRADGFSVLRTVRERALRTPVIVLTGTGTVKDCVEAMRAGAFDFVAKPFDPSALQEVVRQALVVSRVDPDLDKTPPPGEAPLRGVLVGESPAMKGVLDLVQRVADTDATVLLTGESGTGKEVIARLLHASSGRSGRRLVAVNCGAIPEGLIESELFGHAKGAFTGATERRVGKFVEADEGTLFLDEIGELSLSLQVRLLRILQDHEVAPVGSSDTRTVDVRIIAATNQDLERMVGAGKFREDLFYRLAVMPILLPPLRDRVEDIPLLANHFLESAARDHGRPLAFAEDVLAVMKLHSWPGNVRELQNLVARLAILDRDGVIRIEDLPAKMRAGTVAESTAGAALRLPDGGIDLVETLGQVERSLIDEAMRRSGGNKSRAADLLGLNRTTLVEKLKRFGRDSRGS